MLQRQLIVLAKFFDIDPYCLVKKKLINVIFFWPIIWTNTLINIRDFRRKTNMEINNWLFRHKYKSIPEVNLMKIIRVFLHKEINMKSVFESNLK